MSKIEWVILALIVLVVLLGIKSYNTEIITPEGTFNAFEYSCKNGLLFGADGAGNIYGKDGLPLTCEVKQ